MNLLVLAASLILPIFIGLVLLTFSQGIYRAVIAGSFFLFVGGFFIARHVAITKRSLILPFIFLEIVIGYLVEDYSGLSFFNFDPHTGDPEFVWTWLLLANSYIAAPWIIGYFISKFFIRLKIF